MLMLAFGQSKMLDKPVVGLLHLVVYVAFVLINIELLEIVIDGLFGTHRVFQPIIGNGLYGFLVGTFEVLALLVLAVCFKLFADLTLTPDDIYSIVIKR